MNRPHEEFMRVALRLARKGLGRTSPNPMVGAVLTRGDLVIGRGWHRMAGAPHAEVEAIRDAQRQGHQTRGASLYVTLEPCSTHGRTPPCTEAIKAAGIRRVIVGATDPNPEHAGKAFRIFKRTGVKFESGILAEECADLNESFNHWIIHHTPLVTVKAAMTLDGKIATATGESKWITGEKARAYGMRLRQTSDAILVGVNTVLADDPSLTLRGVERGLPLRRIILDSSARTPLDAQVVSDEQTGLTTVVVGKAAPHSRAARLAKRVRVLKAPERAGRIDARWLLRKLGREEVTSLLVEGGGEVNATFLLGRLAHRIAFFYAPKILGGRDARKAVAGNGADGWDESLSLRDLLWRRLGDDLLLTARVEPART